LGLARLGRGIYSFTPLPPLLYHTHELAHGALHRLFANANALSSAGNTNALVVSPAAATGLPQWQSQIGGSEEVQPSGVDTAHSGGIEACGIHGIDAAFPPLGTFPAGGLTTGWLGRYAQAPAARPTIASRCWCNNKPIRILIPLLYLPKAKPLFWYCKMQGAPHGPARGRSPNF
jgi:hypothetical protein